MEEEWCRGNLLEECTVGRLANLRNLLTEAGGAVRAKAQAETITRCAGNETGRLIQPSRGNICQAYKGREVLLRSTQVIARG